MRSGRAEAVSRQAQGKPRSAETANAGSPAPWVQAPERCTLLRRRHTPIGAALNAPVAKIQWSRWFSGAARFFADSKVVLLMFVSSRLLIVGVILLSKMVVVRGPFWQPGGLLGALTQWDSIYYIHIARHGYFHAEGWMSTVAFFPSFPMLVKAMSFVFHDFRLAAVVTANICLLGAGLLLHRLVRWEFQDRRIADTAVTLLMFSPVSFFFSTAYTEATFLMLAIASYYAARRERWLLAGLCGMCLAATRHVGFWMAVPLFIEHLRQSGDWRRPLSGLVHPRILAIALVPLGLVLYMLFGYTKRGDLLAFSHAGADWGRVLVSPLQTLSLAALYTPFYRALFLGALAAAAVLWVAGLLLRLRGSYLVWAALLIVTYLSSNSLEAVPRYLSVVFPLFIVLALLVNRYPWSYTPVLACSMSLLTICTVLLANGYWMT